MGDLDDLDSRGVEGADGLADLILREAVRHRVAAVAQRSVDDAEGVTQGGAVHAATSSMAAAICSPVRAAAAVMMSRFPA